MALFLPDEKLLSTTGDVDYFHWNYRFPIKYIQRFRFKAILSLMGTGVYYRALEIGTGSGIFLKELSRHTKELYAIDVHTHMGDVERLCRQLKLKVSLLSTGIEKTPFPNNFFDLIIGVSVLEFVENLDQAIIEIKRILKESGKFITICPQQNRAVDLILNFYTRKRVEDEFMDKRLYVSKVIEKTFKIEEMHFFPPFLGRIIPIYKYYRLAKT